MLSNKTPAALGGVGGLREWREGVKIRLRCRAATDVLLPNG